MAGDEVQESSEVAETPPEAPAVEDNPDAGAEISDEEYDARLNAMLEADENTEPTDEDIESGNEADENLDEMSDEEYEARLNAMLEADESTEPADEDLESENETDEDLDEMSDEEYEERLNTITPSPQTKRLKKTKKQKRTRFRKSRTSLFLIPKLKTRRSLKKRSIWKQKIQKR